MMTGIWQLEIIPTLAKLLYRPILRALQRLPATENSVCGS